MHRRDDPKGADQGCDEALLARLGFGPDTALMNDPKLLVDRSFLAALIAEFERELGPETTGAVLFRIGLAHGLREAEIALQQQFTAAAFPMARDTTPLAPSLALALGPSAPGFQLMGHWPDLHEAEARLQRVGLADTPSCRLSAGFTSGWLSVTTERDLVVVETECIAAGGTACQFEAREPTDWLEDPRGKQIIGLDLRRGLLAQCPGGPAARPAPAPDPPPHRMPDPTSVLAGTGEHGDKAVHVWGPVMVLPFTYTEEVLATVDMLGRDENTRSVRVVVIDLSDVMLEEGFMAAGLESALDTIDGWGAEAILAGVSPLSEPVVEGLEARHMVTRKDLPDAIATAFQITEAQRHAL